MIRSKQVHLKGLLIDTFSMWAVVSKLGLVARDFPTKPAALAWIKQHNNTELQVINQNNKNFLKYERRSK